MYCQEQDRTGLGGNLRDQVAAIREDTLLKINDFPTVLPEDGFICGRCDVRFYNAAEQEAKYGHRLYFGVDNIHFPMGLFFMEVGIDEIVRLSRKAEAEAEDPVKAEYARGIADTYEAISRFIQRHADAAAAKSGERYQRIAKVCAKIAHEKPESFLEAVQLYWFIWTIRSELSHIHANNQGYYMAPPGRMDMQLISYYRHDIEKGTMTRDQALELIKEMYVKMNSLGSGDTLKSVMLGGSDVDGNDTTNELSHLLVEAMLEVKLPEPHLHIRLHKNTDPQWRKKCMRLICQGQGQGTTYNEEVVLAGLQKAGIPREVAVNYANDGCEEVLLDQDGSILFNELEAMKSFELACFNGEENPHLKPEEKYRRWAHALDARDNRTMVKLGYRSGDVTACETFEEVYDCFIRQYMFQTDVALDNMCENIRKYNEEFIGSLVLAGTYRGSCETGGDIFRDVLPYKIFQLHSGSIPPVADALAAIKYHVFEKGTFTMRQIVDAMATNFEGNEPMRKLLLAAPKFGNDHDLPDLIAADIARRYMERVNSREVPYGMKIWPGIYSIFFADQAELVGATADGRKCADNLAVHFSPMPGRAVSGPTATLCSAAKTHLADGIAASPVFLTISRSLIPDNEEGAALVERLITAGMEMGLQILSLAINDTEALKKAQLDPENYGDIVVRVWGFNARFIDLTPSMQEHVIQRTLMQ